MFKWLFDLMDTRQVIEQSAVPIVIESGSNWDVCFIKEHNMRASFSDMGKIFDRTQEYSSFKEIKYSGRVITTEDLEDIYECLVDGNIKWIRKSLLSFPRTL